MSNTGVPVYSDNATIIDAFPYADLMAIHNDLTVKPMCRRDAVSMEGSAPAKVRDDDRTVVSAAEALTNLVEIIAGETLQRRRSRRRIADAALECAEPLVNRNQLDDRGPTANQKLKRAFHSAKRANDLLHETEGYGAGHQSRP